MISVAEALALVAAQQRNFGAEEVNLRQAIGRILAQPVFADRDFPPYHRVTMDGIAISSTSFEEGRRVFSVEGIQAAGQPQLALSDSAKCIEVMTGAPLPKGVDVVIPYEDCTIAESKATVNIQSINVRQHVHLQGADSRQGDMLLHKGARIAPAMAGIIASVGLDKIAVQRLPAVAVCATGDELVDIAASPLAHQIRGSNSYMLAAALMQAGIVADSYHLPDRPEEMQAQLSGIMERYDIILFSGAVSKGRYDFLPGVLNGLGMQTIFHRVAQKPGKPFLFGTFSEGPLVFGFPGNPVSTLVCYTLFFQHWLDVSLNRAAPACNAQLTEELHFGPALTYHLPVSLKMEAGVLLATPCAGANSGDMISLQKADGMIQLPPEKAHFRKGEAYPLRLLAPFF